MNTRVSKVSAETVENTATKRRIDGTTQVSWQRQRHGQVETQCHRDLFGEIGHTDEELWIFSVEDNSKCRHSVSWKVTPHTRVSETCEQGQMHEMMIDSGCYGHVCPPWFVPQFPLVGCTNIEALTAKSVTQRTKSDLWSTSRTETSWQMTII